MRSADDPARAEYMVRVDWIATRDPRIADAPTIYELMNEYKTPESERRLLPLVFAASDFGRPIVAPPGVPPDRIKILREAFLKTMNDPDRPHHGAPGFRHTFDATEVVKRLKEQHLWDPASLTVTFEPIRVLPPPGAELPPEAVAGAAAPVAPVRIGRVSLFVA